MSQSRLNNRRFAWAIAASLALNILGWGEIGLIWKPKPAAGAARRVMRVVKIVHAPLTPPAPIPLVRVAKTPPKLRPKLPRNSMHRALNAVTEAVVPARVAAKASGGARPAPKTAVHIAARSQPTPTPVRVAILPAPEAPSTASVVITSRVTAARGIAAPTAPVLPAVAGPIAAPSGTGPGVGSGGQGLGKGAASGKDLGNGGGGGAPGLFGLGDTGGGPRHIIYVLDASLSMESRLPRARYELKASLASLGPDESFNILIFFQGLYLLDRNLVPATRENKQRAYRFLDQVDIDEGTDVEYALKRALGLPGSNMIVVVTDGKPTSGQTDMNVIPGDIRRLNVNHVPIYAIGLVGVNPDGTDDSFEAAQMLERIARDSGGVYKQATAGVATPE